MKDEWSISQKRSKHALERMDISITNNSVLIR
jgi:hypothetical protein